MSDDNPRRCQRRGSGINRGVDSHASVGNTRAKVRANIMCFYRPLLSDIMLFCEQFLGRSTGAIAASISISNHLSKLQFINLHDKWVF